MQAGSGLPAIAQSAKADGPGDRRAKNAGVAIAHWHEPQRHEPTDIAEIALTRDGWPCRHDNDNLATLALCHTMQCMPKTEVYSWRCSPETLSALEHHARREGKTVARLLDGITRRWLDRRGPDASEVVEQTRLQRAAMKTFGSIAGGTPQRSAQVQSQVRKRLARRRGGRRIG